MTFPFVNLESGQNPLSPQAAIMRGSPPTVLVFLCILLSPAASDYPFNDPTRSWNDRVQDLVMRLTVDEMTLQIAMGGRSTHAPGIERLGIKPYPWGSECLRGDVSAGPATSFPQALGLAATFSPLVVYNVSHATGLEVRAKYNNYSSHGDYDMHTSASCWSPVINIMRDPRWGRNQETYGEDPFMSGVLAEQFVVGLQGEHPRYVMANAGCKHFDVYAGPENIPQSRFKFDAKVSMTDWRMTFLPAFKRCVKAGTYSVMCSYNSVNGIPACANKELLTDILRKEWGFYGYVISDEGAIENIMDAHNYTKTKPDTAAAAINAGCNLEDGPPNVDPYLLAISDAVKQGKLTKSAVREAVAPLFYTRMRLGLFDPPGMNPYAKLDPATYVQSAWHRELSILTAMRSFVLLKNSQNFLPLKAGHKFGTLAIVGPLADNTDAIFGGYAPTPNPKYIISPRAGLAPLATSVSYEPGCKDAAPTCAEYDGDAVKKAVTGSDLVVVALGTGCDIECEGRDRPDINLPGKQLQLLQDAVAAAGSAPVILLLFNAGPLDVSWAINKDQVVVIMECYFPAQGAGEALRRVFYNEGEASNPGARLPNTWPASLDQVPPMTDYSMKGRTYRYLNSTPMYPFGFGLSYSTYEYLSLEVRPASVHYTDEVTVNVYVGNQGPFDGEEVVQVYVSWGSTSAATPRLQLVGFNRYFIKAGEGISCIFKVPLEDLAVWDETGSKFVTPKGKYTVYVGGQQPFQQTKVNSNILSGTFSVS